MLEHLLDLASRNHVDLTGYNQHGYKKDSSAVITALKLQSIIAKALDNKKDYKITSLDLRHRLT